MEHLRIGIPHRARETNLAVQEGQVFASAIDLTPRDTGHLNEASRTWTIDRFPGSREDTIDPFLNGPDLSGSVSRRSGVPVSHKDLAPA